MDDTNMMSEGSIAKKIIYFAIPLFLGNLFQQLYNTADSLIVGNFLGSSALAAVASSGNLIFLLVGFFNGISVGAGVVIARFFGAHDHRRVHLSIHTTVALGIVCGDGCLLLYPRRYWRAGSNRSVFVKFCDLLPFKSQYETFWSERAGKKSKI